MKYDIIETGSGGNAVVFNDVVMVDCGVSFKKLIPYYLKLQVVLLTHIHGDHFNRATIRRLAMERPALRFACGNWLVPMLVYCGVQKGNIDVCQKDCQLWYTGFSFIPFELDHDVSNLGYKIWFENEVTCEYETVVYATDTCTLPDLPGCDYYFIEANYKNTEELEARIRAKQESGEHVYENRVIENHMSEDYALNWLVRNGRPDSQHVFLHEHLEK